MGYSNVFSIIDGIEISHTIVHEDFQKLVRFYLDTKRNSAIVKQCAEYHAITIEEVDEENFTDFLHDRDYLIDCEYLHNFYIGTQILSIWDNDPCYAMKMEEIPQFPKVDSAIFEFIQTLFPHCTINRYIVYWIC